VLQVVKANAPRRGTRPKLHLAMRAAPLCWVGGQLAVRVSALAFGPQPGASISCRAMANNRGLCVRSYAMGMRPESTGWPWSPAQRRRRTDSAVQRKSSWDNPEVYIRTTSFCYGRFPMLFANTRNASIGRSRLTRVRLEALAVHRHRKRSS